MKDKSSGQWGYRLTPRLATGPPEGLRSTQINLGTANPMRWEIREMQARKRRIQIGFVIAAAIIVALVVFLFDAAISP